HGAPAISFHDAACRTVRGLRPVALHWIWHRDEFRMDARQTVVGAPVGRLPPGMRPPARHLRTTRQSTLASLLPLVQCSARHRAGTGTDPCGGQTFLNGNMTDSKPRKTLTLARKAAPAATSAEDAGTRKRSGARARQVAQLRHEQEKGVLPNTETRPSAARKRPAARRSEPVSPTPSAEVDRPRIVRTRSERPHGKQRPSRRQEIFQAFAPCPMGLEEALHAELEALGYGGLIKARAGCHFEADWTGILKANLYSRLATRVLVRVAHAPV